MSTILVVEDEPGLQMGLQDLFEDAEYQVHVFGEGKPALQALDTLRPDLVVLDLTLPDMDGTLFLEKCRKYNPDLPVLILTARASESDVLYGFRLGADDYVTKPFSPMILLARVSALLKRAVKPEGVVMLGELMLDFERYEAKRGACELKLTTREFELLKFLYANLGVPVNRNDILDEVWGMDAESGPRSVDTHVLSIRKKIEPQPEKPMYLLSQRGVGYKLVDPLA